MISPTAPVGERDLTLGSFDCLTESQTCNETFGSSHHLSISPKSISLMGAWLKRPCMRMTSTLFYYKSNAGGLVPCAFRSCSRYGGMAQDAAIIIVGSTIVHLHALFDARASLSVQLMLRVSLSTEIYSG